MKKVNCKHDTMIIPKTAYIALAQLPDADLGKYIRMIFEYGFSDIEPELSPMEAAMLAPIFEFINKNKETYEGIVNSRKKAANARWHKDACVLGDIQTMHMDANECKCIQMDANDALNINNNINNNINKNIDSNNIDISVSKDTDCDSEAKASSSLKQTDKVIYNNPSDNVVLEEDINNYNEAPTTPPVGDLKSAFNELCKIRRWNLHESNKQTIIDSLKLLSLDKAIACLEKYKTNGKDLFKLLDELKSA